MALPFCVAGSVSGSPVAPAAPPSPAVEAAGSEIQLPKTSESPQLLRIRHSMSHVMAMAVQKLFPQAKVTIGPWTETGFYYDFDHPEPFTEADLKAIKKEMVRIIGQGLPLERIEVSRGEAERRIAAQNEPYKLEILAGLSEPITIYTLGDGWWDLCAGPHVANTRELHPKAFDLESVAGAYWRGNEANPQLQRMRHPPPAGGGQAAQSRGPAPRSPPAGQRSGSVFDRGGGGRRPGVLASAGGAHAPADRGFLAAGPF